MKEGLAYESEGVTKFLVSLNQHLICKNYGFPNYQGMVFKMQF